MSRSSADAKARAVVRLVRSPIRHPLSNADKGDAALGPTSNLGRRGTDAATNPTMAGPWPGGSSRITCAATGEGIGTSGIKSLQRVLQ
jgi:hypothetical protein